MRTETKQTADARKLAEETEDRGRQAQRPRDVPKAGWRDVLIRTWKSIGHDNLGIIAAGIAFYALLALFPALAALIALWGLLFDPAEVEAQLANISALLPEEAADIIRSQARDLTSASSQGGVTLAAVVGLLLALYSATKGMRAMIGGLNIVYNEREKRSFFRLQVVNFVLTVCAIVGTLATLAVIAVLPVALNYLLLPESTEQLLTWLRWPILLTVVILSLGVIFRFAPSRSKPRWQWVSWGAALAALLWIVGSVGFSIYVRNFASYNETYGSLGAVVILLMWFWLSAYVVLVGAELNSELEHQTTRDSTDGGDQPFGERGAFVADTVGKSP